MIKVLLFAGTEEGRKLAEYLSQQKIPTHVCVATEYGKDLLGENLDGVTITSARYDEAQMVTLLQENSYELIIDATHPYAKLVSENCRSACEKCNKTYLRVVRKSLMNADANQRVQYVSSMTEAMEYLTGTEGAILATTGSKEMEQYLTLPDGKERVYHRVLSTIDVMEKCRSLGIEGRHVFAMQGPFSEEMNYAMIQEIHARYLVTKEAGQAGGYEEKIQAAIRAGITAVVIGRPVDETGYSIEELYRLLQEKYGIQKPTIQLIGIGTDGAATITVEARDRLKEADLVFGAKRMVDATEKYRKQNAMVQCIYDPKQIVEYLHMHPAFHKVAVLYSGDIGFYSGAKKLIQQLESAAFPYHCIPGISSGIAFMAKLGLPWEDVTMTSMHGRDENLVGILREQAKVLTLLGGKESVRELCDLLLENHLEQVTLTIGQRLSYPEESILTGSPLELRDKEWDSLVVAYMENPMAKEHIVTHGIPDECFLREQVPMTKMEIRSISLSKLQLTRDAICYDIGAGTGSVTVEMANMALHGRVYAIEKNPAAQELLQQNIEKFGMTNVTLVKGRAIECMDALPVPSHAFIGGSTGDLEKMIRVLFQRNPGIRIVTNIIALDTLCELQTCMRKMPEVRTEYVQVSIAKSKKIGSYDMMMGQNPVYIVTLVLDPREEGQK